MIKITRAEEPVLTKVKHLKHGDCFIMPGSSSTMMLVQPSNYSRFNAVILNTAEMAIVDQYVCVTKVMCEMTVKLESDEV